MKTDNGSVPKKLAVRRAAIDEYRTLTGKESIAVLDCYSGGEVMWGELAKDYAVSSYLALDVKSKRARIKADCRSYLALTGWSADVVDLDAYGSPWHAFELALLNNESKCFVVALTIGNVAMGQQQHLLLDFMGVPRETPPGLHKAIAEACMAYGLNLPRRAGCDILSAYHASNKNGSSTTHYYSMIVKKKH